LQHSSDEPFILHNVDVLSTIDLEEMVTLHRKHDALATLAVRERKSSRYLLFNGHSELCGRKISKGGAEARAEMVRECEHPRELAFCGIHVISPRLLRLMREEGAFSVIDVYLRLAGAGEQIRAFGADEYYWRDVGRLEDLAQASADASSGILILPTAAPVQAARTPS
jgi:NDP-sugar pyrophosphorylase family protein